MTNFQSNPAKHCPARGGGLAKALGRAAANPMGDVMGIMGNLQSKVAQSFGAAALAAMAFANDASALEIGKCYSRDELLSEMKAEGHGQMVVAYNGVSNNGMTSILAYTSDKMLSTGYIIGTSEVPVNSDIKPTCYKPLGKLKNIKLADFRKEDVFPSQMLVNLQPNPEEIKTESNQGSFEVLSHDSVLKSSAEKGSMLPIMQATNANSGSLITVVAKTDGSLGYNMITNPNNGAARITWHFNRSGFGVDFDKTYQEVAAADRAP